LATAPCTTALILVAYQANLLDTVEPTTRAAVSQGHRVALVACACVAAAAALRLLLAAWLDPRLLSRSGRPQLSVKAKRTIAGGAAAAVVGVALALALPHGLVHDWNRFFSGVAPHGNNGDLRRRLTDPANNGRSDLWKVALNGFSSAPVEGHGAGMYQTLWDRQRPRFAYTVNAHSLYLQAIAELGLPGLLLLLLLVGAALGGLVARARGPNRSLYGALLAASVIWVVHAGVDWDWEMPVITLPFFAIAGLGLSPRRKQGRTWSPGNRTRALLAMVCVAAVVLPLLVIGSQSRLTEAEHALYASNCAKATSAAKSSSGWLSERPEPYEIVGFCDMQSGHANLAVAQMRMAVKRDPGSWERYLALSIAQGSAGIDPRPAMRHALQVNPLEPLTLEGAKTFVGSNPSQWPREARRMRQAALASNHLSIVPS
jgi:hypothetical protein